MIDTTERLIELLDSSRPISGRVLCAVDTEADSLHRYRESLCLIQFATVKHKTLIDPLVIKDLSPLGSFLSEATVWMHGADYDMTMFKRQFNRLPKCVYDTQIGARLLGHRRFGLSDLVLHYFGIELSKSSQKADWGKRPLSEKMIEYALNDVHYLLEMGERIVAELREKNRFEWFEESCEAAQRRVLERDDEQKDDAWRIQGSGKLDPYGLACLRALWQWRDAEAKAWDRPSFMVTPNRELLEWTQALIAGKSIVLPRHYRIDRQKRFHAAMVQLAKIPQHEWPQRPQSQRAKRDRHFEERVDSMIAKREAIAKELDIEGSLIASRATIECIASNQCSPADVLLNWQRKCLDL